MKTPFLEKILIVVITISIIWGCGKEDSKTPVDLEIASLKKRITKDIFPSPIVRMQYRNAYPLFEARKYEEAIIEFHKLVEIDSTFSPAYFILGVSYLKLFAQKVKVEERGKENVKWNKELAKLFVLGITALKKVSLVDPQNKYQVNELANQLLNDLTKNVTPQLRVE
jgi:hypothetical protein